MSLAKLLEPKFRGDIRHRGQVYWKAGRVSITHVSADTVHAVVRDGEEHQTEIKRADGDLEVYCSSVEGTKKPRFTKYVWATILAVDEAGYVTGTPKPGHIPPFVSEVDSLSFNDDYEDDLDDLEIFTRSKKPKFTDEEEIAPKVKLKEWEQVLVDLKDQLRVDRVSGNEVERETEVFYEIDLEQSKAVKKLVLQTSQRQRRADGQWGKLKGLRIKPEQLDRVQDQADRQILAYLFGGMPEKSSSGSGQTDRWGQTYRFHLAVEFCEILLPMMCETGRVFLLDQGTVKRESIRWDSGPSWELALKLDREKSSDKWKLDCELTRAGEHLRISDAELLLPGGLVIHENRISRLNDFGAFRWVELIGDSDPLTVNPEDEQDLVDRILDVPTLPRLELPKELQLEEIRVDPKPRLVIQLPGPRTGFQRERVQADVTFVYDGVNVPGNSMQWAVVQREEQRCLVRNDEREEQFWGRLRDVGFRRLVHDHLRACDVDIPARELGHAVRVLMNEGWEIDSGGQRVREAQNIQFRVQSGIDWFGVSAEVKIDDATISFPELLSALVRGDTTIRLDDGSLAVVPEEWREQYGLLAGFGSWEEEELRFSNTQLGLLDALLATQESVDYDQEFLELRKQIRDFEGIEEVKEPKAFVGELRSYQRMGLGWLNFLERFRFGGCLADDMGLGKTVQVLALLQKRLDESKGKKPSLVVVPKSLLFNWVQESQRFTPRLKVLEYFGLDREGLRDDISQYDLVITTYGTLRRDVVALREMSFDYVILDEAQTIKNSSSQVSKACRLLQADHRLALTGTPIENHLGDLWSIFEFLNPGMLGRSSVFKSVTSDAQSEQSQQLLAKGLRPFVLRRTKRQVASELPEKFEETIYCDLGEKQKKLYEELRDHYRQSILGLVKKQGLNRSKMHVLEALLRLRQAACHPGLINQEDQDEPYAKIETLNDRLAELIDEGHKALVFSQFTSMLAIVRKFLDKAGIEYAYLDGQTRNRQEVVERFQEEESTGVFLISLKAGGLGLNLTAADYVFLLDPWWNPAVETQAIDRAYRIGQKQNVFAYRLIARNTVEEKIAELQKKKKKLADAILQADGNMMKDLTTDDLTLLLS